MSMNIVNLEEFLLSHGELAKRVDMGDTIGANEIGFERDFSDGNLNRYKGTFVLYHKGIMVGQSRKGEQLFKEAAGYYGSSNLTVFEVPEEQGDLANSVKITAVSE